MPTEGRLYVTHALREIGKLSSTAVANAEQETDCLQVLNDLLGTWRRESLFIPGVTITDYPFVVGRQANTIGAGGNFNQVYPYAINSWSVITSDGFELPYGHPVEVAYWQSIRDKAARGRPRILYFDEIYNAGLMKCYFYPTPDSAAESARLYQQVPVITAVTAAGNYDLEAGYDRAIKLGLAVEIADRYGKDVTDRLERRAIHAIGAIKRKNYKPKEALIRPEYMVGRGQRGPFNIYTGGA